MQIEILPFHAWHEKMTGADWESATSSMMSVELAEYIAHCALGYRDYVAAALHAVEQDRVL